MQWETFCDFFVYHPYGSTFLGLKFRYIRVKIRLGHGYASIRTSISYFSLKQRGKTGPIICSFRLGFYLGFGFIKPSEKTAEPSRRASYVPIDGLIILYWCYNKTRFTI